MDAPVFIAANVAEVDFVERLLDEEGIEFDVRPDAFVQRDTSGPCLQGLLFLVREGQAEYCRKLIAQRGLARGVVDATQLD